MFKIQISTQTNSHKKNAATDKSTFLEKWV